MHRSISLAILLAAFPLVTLGAATARAATPETYCQGGRYAAAAKYAECELKAHALYYKRGYDYELLPRLLAKCLAKYQATWPKLQAKAAGTGTPCDRPRFQVLAGGTVRDNLTALEWEQKSDDSGIHDVDDLYTWSQLAFTAPANGTAFTTLLATLNGDCFAGQCDWRLPTRTELQTILLAPYPCGSDPCIDEAVFGPTTSYFYWTSTTFANQVTAAEAVGFMNGIVGGENKDVSYSVRAVRGGL